MYRVYFIEKVKFKLAFRRKSLSLAILNLEVVLNTCWDMFFLFLAISKGLTKFLNHQQ